MGQQSKIVLLKLMLGIAFIILLLTFVISWPIGLILTCIFALLMAIANLVRPQIFSTVFAKKPDPNTDEYSLDLPGPLGNTFITTCKLSCHDGNIPIEFMLDKERFIIGRNRNCDYILDFSNRIGRKHCVITYDKAMKRHMIFDNQSKHGTKLNGTKLVPGVSMPLNVNDEINIEDYRFVVLPISHR